MCSRNNLLNAVDHFICSGTYTMLIVAHNLTYQ